jgi:hypothetical protein
VLDQSGNVVGVSFASIEKGQNLNFAIPSDYLAALQDATTDLRPFTTIPRAKARTTLLDRIGNERPMAGVVGENLTYDGVSIQTGQFSFSVYNKLRPTRLRPPRARVRVDVGTRDERPQNGGSSSGGGSTLSSFSVCEVPFAI